MAPDVTGTAWPSGSVELGNGRFPFWSDFAFDDLLRRHV